MYKSILFASAILVFGAGCQLDLASPNPTDQASIGCKTYYDVQTALKNPDTACKLDVSGKGLTGALPSQIGQLTNLAELDASDNKMTGLPAELGQLSKLEILNVSNNRLTGLPMELANLTQLRIFDISGNQYSKQDLVGIEASLTKTEIRK